jgi:hypothetical protein
MVVKFRGISLHKMHPELVTHDSVKDRDLYFLSVGEASSFPDSYFDTLRKIRGVPCP